MSPRGRSRLSKAERQRIATERWLSQQGVRDAQNAKARARMRKKKLMAQQLPSARQCAERTERDEFTPAKPFTDPRTITTFDEAMHAFDSWVYDWGPEETWVDKYQELLSKALSDSHNPLFKQMGEDFRNHVKSGWAIVDAMRNMVHQDEEGFNTDVFDTLVALVTEMRFFERMDEATCRKEARQLAREM
ncbi:hypothetical protein CONPUDRAFT_68744 [Coniophora puteana RWD-64-598 SS2]|uniref:Uncharacterized protein n=1 Tax=Coniophora puteana (strain RWD-64-598) TaxID=741705 RepID=A0A5M3N430_CONPW|nr:uncharacterized protein CONPUDRAFT_68744 [Coniophora puteana RWD-64-598 SS2]EIW86143.1 hypothetical protein CONPUDRAFT_68744 [Coniophora puteana RWD-64-598 SS2]